MLTDAGQQLLKAAQPDFEQMRVLLASGADLNELDVEEGETIFTQLVAFQHHLIYDFISMGGRVSVPEQHGGHPLIYAVWCLDYGLLRRLLEAEADANQIGFKTPDDESMTALDAVAMEYHCQTDPHAHLVLDAMGALLRQYDAKYKHQIV